MADNNNNANNNALSKTDRARKFLDIRAYVSGRLRHHAVPKTITRSVSKEFANSLTISLGMAEASGDTDTPNIPRYVAEDMLNQGIPLDDDTRGCIDICVEELARAAALNPAPPANNRQEGRPDSDRADSEADSNHNTNSNNNRHNDLLDYARYLEKQNEHLEKRARCTKKLLKRAKKRHEYDTTDSEATTERENSDEDSLSEGSVATTESENLDITTLSDTKLLDAKVLAALHRKNRLPPPATRSRLERAFLDPIPKTRRVTRNTNSLIIKMVEAALANDIKHLLQHAMAACTLTIQTCDGIAPKVVADAGDKYMADDEPKWARIMKRAYKKDQAGRGFTKTTATTSTSSSGKTKKGFKRLPRDEWNKLTTEQRAQYLDTGKL
eukprot:PhM_4_TR14170/c6_g3_i3/m.47362